MKSGASEVSVAYKRLFRNIFDSWKFFSHNFGLFTNPQYKTFDKMAERIHLFKINRVSEANKVHILPSFSRKRLVIVTKMASDALK